MARRESLKARYEGYLYILPAFALILMFGLYPIAHTVFVSLHRWRIRRGAFIGLENFQNIFGSGFWLLLLLTGIALLFLSLSIRDRALRRARLMPRLLASSRLSRMNAREKFLLVLHWVIMLTALLFVVVSLPGLYSAGDEDMLDSLRVTIWYSIGAVPLQLGGGLAIAWLLNRKFRGRQLFRVIFLLPYIVPIVAGAAVFERLFSLRPESFANQLLISLGLSPQEWLLDRRGIFGTLFNLVTPEGAGDFISYWSAWFQGPSLALVSILFFNWWVFTGYYALIYANGLSQIPRELYEAAEVDGAPRRSVFFRIVLPLLSPTTYFLSLLGIIGTFKSFSHIWVLRNNMAGGAADPLSIYIFTVFYSRSRFGYASALSIVLMAIVLLLTAVQNRIMKNRIHYGD